MANENVENGIDSDIVNSSPNEWLDLPYNYDLVAKGVVDNDEYVNAFVCMAYTGGSKDEDEDEDEDNGNEFQRPRPNPDPISNDTIIDSMNCACQR